MTWILWVATWMACTPLDPSAGEQWVEGDLPEREEESTIDVPTQIAFWAGEAEVEPDINYVGVGWFVVLNGTADDAEDWTEADPEALLCVLTYETDSDQVAQNCDDCEFAFAVSSHEASLETGDASICSEYGMDVEHLATKIDKLGYKDGQLLVGSDGGWESTQGTANYIDDTLSFWYLY
ncbi:MAG: hypothetical protein VX519_06800 [Myxococcota bacterium]|nr:hypothetical protein [Myxococcota bacterium]